MDLDASMSRLHRFGPVGVTPTTGLRPCCTTQVGIALLTVQLASLGSKNKEMVHGWSHWLAAIYASALFLDPKGRQTLCRCAQATG